MLINNADMKLNMGVLAGCCADWKKATLPEPKNWWHEGGWQSNYRGNSLRQYYREDGSRTKVWWAAGKLFQCFIDLTYEYDWVNREWYGVPASIVRTPFLEQGSDLLPTLFNVFLEAIVHAAVWWNSFQDDALAPWPRTSTWNTKHISLMLLW